MASGPNSSAMPRRRPAMVSRASSQEIRSNWPWPFAPTRRCGWSRRPGEYSRSRYCATLPHRNPRVTGCAGSPRSLEPRPSSTLISSEQQSGQSSAHTEWRVSAIEELYRRWDRPPGLSLAGPACHPARPLSRPLRRISRVAVDLFADDSFGGLVQILVKRRAQLLILGPQRLIDERRRNPYHHGGVALPLVAIRLQPVAAAQRREQTPLPPVRHAELEFPRLLGLLRDAERLLDALDGRRRGVAFPRRGGAFEQSRDLAQPGPELFLGDHRYFLMIPRVGQALPPANISAHRHHGGNLRADGQRRRRRRARRAQHVQCVVARDDTEILHDLAIGNDGLRAHSGAACLQVAGLNLRHQALQRPAE